MMMMLAGWNCGLGKGGGEGGTRGGNGREHVVVTD